MTESSQQRGRWPYRAGVALAVLISFLTLWTTIVRDDGNGGGFFLLIMAAMVGAFACWFGAAGMARTMLGVAAMHMTWGFAVATAPVVARVPGASMHFLLTGGVFAALWLAAAACFLVAARRGR